MIVKGFYHIWLVNNWQEIFQEQLKIVHDSGLYHECEEISIGCLGSLEQKEILKKLIEIHPKFKIKAYSENPIEYEFITLKLIEKDDAQYIGFYFHTKGVTKPNDHMQPKERWYLNEIMLNQWRAQKHILETGYDMASPNYLTIPRRFTGNFWWFHRRIINKLPKLSELDHTIRYNAEYWWHMTCLQHPIK